MYNVKGPSKIVAKTTRRGIQSLDHAKPRPATIGDVLNDPKPIFQNVAKKNGGTHGCRHPQEAITPEHEELILFISESWNSACSLETGSPTATCYYSEEPSPRLQNFKPFDLEGWWGKRLYNYITNSVNHKC